MDAPTIVPKGQEPPYPSMQELKNRAYDCLSVKGFDTLITYDELRRALHVNPETNHRARTAVLAVGRRLLREQNKKLLNVRTVGYRIIAPGEHVSASQMEQRRARRFQRRALDTVTHVDVTALTQLEVGKLMTEQARTAILVALTTRLTQHKELPRRQDLQMPSAGKLIDMMRRKST